MREHHLAAEPDDPREHGDRADQHGGPADPPAPLPSTPPFGYGRAHPPESGRWAGIVTRGGCGAGGSVSDGSVSDGSVSDGWGAGLRPSMSSQFSAGVRAITLV